MKIWTALTLLLFILIYGNITAQENKPDCAKNPCWIAMINDTSANYFETVKAFDLFWEGKEIPKGEHEDIGEDVSPQGKKDKKIGENDKKTRGICNRKAKKEKESDTRKYRFEVKKYRHWKQEVLPYVQEDGHILTPTERLKIYNDQKAKP